MQGLLLSLLVAGFCAHAADIPAAGGVPATPVRPQFGDSRKQLSLWKISAATLLASNVLDAGSSWGKRELNPVLSGSTGSFGGKSALLKLGVEAGVVTVEYLVLRHRPSRLSIKALTWINFGDASATTAMAVRNFGIAGR
jgi:hypothetical protein